MERLIFTNALGESVVLDGAPFYLSRVDGLGDVGAFTNMQRVPYQHGAIRYDSQLDVREVAIQFLIVEDGGYQDVSAARAKMGRVFNPTLDLGVLRYENDSVVREIEAIADTVPAFPDSVRTETMQKGFVSLICPDPYWKSLHQTTRALKAYEPKFVLPVTLPASMGEVGDFTTVLNEGDVEAPVLITVSGPVVNPEITNETTGETLRINVTLSVGDVLYIDTDPRKKRVEIHSDGVLARKAFGLIDRDYAKSSLWKLAPGENNLSYVADQGNENATVVVQWNERFVAV